VSEPARYASPVRGPQGVAWDGALLWVTSAADGRVYAIDPQSWTVARDAAPPAEALGITWTGADFRLILAPAIDAPDLERDVRYVYRFAPEAGFAECFACPDGSGSHIAHANGTFYVSQAWDKKIVELDARGVAVREVPLVRRPVGLTVVDDAFYLATVDEDWNDGRFERLGLRDDPSSIEALRSFAFKPRGVAFDGERFWVADRNADAIVSFA
jgi:hypothetical protein